MGLPLEWVLPIILAAPHILYMQIWFFPQTWRKRFGKSAVSNFANIAALLKVLQFTAVLYWYAQACAPAALFDIRAVSLLNAIAAIAFGVAGQALNIGIFKAIGHEGVYYGFKLGHRIPWVTGFPFSVVQHPQYVGSVLSIWSLVILVWQQRPEGVLPLALYWSALYAVTAVQESYF